MKAIGEKSAQSKGAEPLIFVARAAKTRGLKGEIVADLLTDFPERFEDLTRLFAVGSEGERKTVELEGYWPQKGRVVLKLKGYDSIEAAKSLVGWHFAVPESERVELGEDEFYDWELEGCGVATVTGRQIGTVKRVMRTGAVDLLVVGGGSEREILIPMAKTIMVEIDTNKKSIVIDAPEGLLEL